MKSSLRFILPLFFLLTQVCNGCKVQEEKPVNHVLLDGIEKRKKDPWNLASVDSATAMLRTGDLVMRTGNDITSYMLCQLNQRDKTYSHCGLVIVENGYPFVYHSIGGEANPDARMKRDSAAHWLSPADNLGFGIARLSIPNPNIDSLKLIVKKIYKERRRFDLNFDITTDDELYCAEFVYKAVNQAMSDNKYLKPTTIFGYSFVGIDDIFLSPHARMICQIRFK